MYQTGLVAVIKVNGRVLREDRGEVLIPFGSEYSVLVKNLKVQRVKIRMTIDGSDAFDGTEIVIPAHSEVELERFIRNGNFSAGNRFKFIERTAGIENYRGIKVDDGLIRIEYWTEKVHDPYVLVNNAWTHEYGTPWKNPWSHGFKSFDSIDSSPSRGITCSSIPTSEYYSAPVNENGITVAGSQSNQQFTTCSWFETDPRSEVLILKLCGQTKTQKVVNPVTVQMKKVCQTCGKKSRGGVSFCPQCGTSLTLI